MTTVYLAGVGWVTGAGLGWGGEGERALPTATQPFSWDRSSDLPLPALTRKDVFPEPNQRYGRMSGYAKLGLAAIAFSLRDAGLESWQEKRPIGVVAGTRLGCLATDVDYHRTVLLEGGGLASPNLFAYTLANCFLGDAAIQFGLTGSLLAVNEPGEGELAPFRMALDELEIGDAETVLAGCCDLAAPEMIDAAAMPHGAVFLALTVNPPEVESGYGTVSLSGDGGILHDGVPVASLAELVQRVLGRGLAPQVPVPLTAAEGVGQSPRQSPRGR